ncbi:hypothetical protein LJR219_000860 [Phenylobacterium sp. LjRoot219]|uniref:hypothetical protein n=1 Tax=Phenylobacterium sp. LjRoot219 TaxID=3342283 RepID=UPI003ECC7CF8
MITTAAPRGRFWRTAALCALAAAPSVAFAQVTPEGVQQAIVTVEDPLEQETVLSTERAVRSTRGVFRTPYNDTYLRAYVHKEAGKVRFEVRQSFNYAGSYRQFEQVNYETARLPASAQVRLLESNREHCQAIEFAMACLEKVAFEVSEAELRRIAQASGGDLPDAWELKFKAAYGQDHRATLPKAEIQGLLRAVDAYRTARNFAAPQTELALNDAEAAR